MAKRKANPLEMPSEEQEEMAEIGVPRAELVEAGRKLAAAVGKGKVELDFPKEIREAMPQGEDSVATMPADRDEAITAPPKQVPVGFCLRRLKLRNRITHQKRELCVPWNMPESEWPIKRAATGPIEVVANGQGKGQKEIYSEEDRDAILAEYGFGRLDPLKKNDIGPAPTLE